MALTAHSCSRAATSGACAKGRSLFIVADGIRVCLEHMTPAERSYREACSHSLAPTGRCSFCGQTNVLVRAETSNP